MESSSRTGATVEGNAAEVDAVSFLNSYAASSLSTVVSDGALRSPVTIETPGFNDLIESEKEDDEERRSSAGVASSTETATDRGTGADGGMMSSARAALTETRSSDELARTSCRTSDSGSEGTGENGPGEERLANCNLPPNSQIEEANNLRFEAAFISLMKMLNDCMDKGTSASTSASSAEVSTETTCAGATQTDPQPPPPPLTSQPPAMPSSSRGSSYGHISNSAGIFLDRESANLRPVCEIRPFVDLSRCVATVEPVIETADNTRSRSGGSNSRRRGRGSQTRRNARRVAQDEGNDDDEDYVPPRETRGRGRARRSRRAPSFSQDGLEIVETRPGQSAQVPFSVTEEETAMAAAVLEDLVELDSF